ncbi:GTP pyrophosphokinase family protein [Ectopseudomonas mendocina]
MESLEREFRELKPKYERLAENTANAIKQFITERGIPSFDIEKRVKEEKSFIEKSIRKSYSQPFAQMEDIAGVRVICYYKEDLLEIDKIIKNNFTVISYSNKQEEKNSDQFGYLSNHYITKIKDEWLHAPNYRGLQELKIEIQVRTILMHAWAAISHKLLYKKQEDIPREFSRKLNRLSALIELADEQFEDIKQLKIDYQENVNEFIEDPINSDNFLAMMSGYFPNRSLKESDIEHLLEEIRDNVTSLKDFETRIKKCLPFLTRMEQEEYPNEKLPAWGLTGVARTILDLTSDQYWATRDLPHPYDVITTKYRKLINNN